jgi:hypothetical protein
MARPFPPIELPNYREGETEDFPWPRIAGVKPRCLALTIGRDPASGRPAEVFLEGARSGSDQDERIDNDMIAISKLLQAGSDPAELAATFGPASLMGAVALRVAHRAGLARDPSAPDGMPAPATAGLRAQIRAAVLEALGIGPKNKIHHRDTEDTEKHRGGNSSAGSVSSVVDLPS